MGDWLSLTRAARLVGVTRAELQKKMREGELVAHDGMVGVANLLHCYPQAQLEETAESVRVASIKERAFGKRVFERALPDAEVLAERVTELSRRAAASEAQLRHLNTVLGGMWDSIRQAETGEKHEAADWTALRIWLEEAVAQAMEPGFMNPLCIKQGVLSVLAAQVTLLPSRQEFIVEGQATLLEAALRAGVALHYGCSGGNCGQCKGRVVSGQVKQTRHHDFPLTEAEKAAGVVLMCSHTAVSDIVIEAAVSDGVQDIPFQQIVATLKDKTPLGDEVMLLHVQTPRSQRLRFLAGQRVQLQVGQAYTAVLPIASCPCDDRNLLFHVHRQPGNLFSDYVFDRLRKGEVVQVEGPQGEFILHEKSARPLYFIALDCGFAPIKSLVEHALSLEVAEIHLDWVGSTPTHLYQPNVGRAWADALDGFHYAEHVADMDLRTLPDWRAEKWQQLLAQWFGARDGLLQGDVYLAGPAAAVALAEQYFMARGLSQARIFVEAVA